MNPAQMLAVSGTRESQMLPQANFNKGEAMKKRYVATIEFYVWAETDEAAIMQAEIVCKQQRDKEDNSCALIELAEQPFGTMGNRSVALSHV